MWHSQFFLKIVDSDSGLTDSSELPFHKVVAHMLCKAVFPVCYLVILKFHPRYQYILIIIVTALHNYLLWVLCLLNLIKLVMMKMITIYNDITLLQNPMTYAFYMSVSFDIQHILELCMRDLRTFTAVPIW